TLKVSVAVVGIDGVDLECIAGAVQLPFHIAALVVKAGQGTAQQFASGVVGARLDVVAALVITIRGQRIKSSVLVLACLHGTVRAVNILAPKGRLLPAGDFLVLYEASVVVFLLPRGCHGRPGRTRNIPL